MRRHIYQKTGEMRVRYFLVLFVTLSSILTAADDHISARVDPPINPETNKARPIAIELKNLSPSLMILKEAIKKGIFTLLINSKTHKISSPSGKVFKVSLLTEDQLNKLFQEMAEQKHIPFCYPEDGCYARAHEMTQLMEKKGVVTGKVFLEGDLRVETTNAPKGFVEWWYHVAPFVAVKKEGKTILYVIDPSLFKKPVTIDEWVKLQTSHKNGKIDEIYHTKRYNYLPGAKKEELDSYQSQDITDTKQTLQSYLQIQLERIKEKK